TTAPSSSRTSAIKRLYLLTRRPEMRGCANFMAQVLAKGACKLNRMAKGTEVTDQSRARRVTACMLIIGDEILSGRTRDANLAYLAKWLNEEGVELKEARVLPDEEPVIVRAVNEVRAAFDYVFTTGGI